MQQPGQIKGLSLIELMVVVAIIAILSAIAIPAYQDYVVRAQVAEGIGLTTSARVAITTHYGDRGDYPTDNLAAGVATPSSTTGLHVASVTIGDSNGMISVAINGTASSKLQTQTLTMQVTDNDGSLNWQCSGTEPRYLPASCR